MSMQEYVEGLRRKHALLEEEIDVEVHRPRPDQATLTRLKREKISVKNAIVNLGFHAAAIAGGVSADGQLAYASGSGAAIPMGRLDDLEASPATEFQGKIFIGTGELENAQAISEHVLDFLSSLGYEIGTEGSLERGSWKKIFRFGIVDDNAMEKIKDRVIAAENALHGHFSSETDQKIINSASNLIGSLQNVDNVVIDAGPFLIFKVKDGESSSLFLKRLNLDDRIVIDENPDLLEDPKKILRKLKNYRKIESQSAQHSAVGLADRPSPSSFSN